MEQRINLYQDRFKDIQPFMSARHGLITVAATVVMLLISSIWYELKRSDAQQLHELSVAQKEQATQQLASLRKELQARLADTAIEQQLRKVSNDISVRQRMIDFVSNNQFGSGRGFSLHLLEMASMDFKDVWLNEISLREDFVRLSGSALKAEMVPQYFSEIQEREMFEGRVFDVFEVDRASTTDWKVDFVIASRAQGHE